MINRETTDKNDTIFYAKNRLLTWNDFKGTPDYNSEGGAITASGFAFNANMNMAPGGNVNLNINVFTFFSKKNSWKKPNINSAYHLLHEQHHFDITMLSAQKFCDSLLKANFTISNYNQLLTDIFNKLFEANSALQKKYDTETNHSINKPAQLAWNKIIEEEIKAL